MSTLEAVQRALTERVTVTPRGSDAELVTLPLAFSNGNLVQIDVVRLSEDRWLVSDRGAAAGELALHGVDMESRRVAGESWSSLVRQMRVNVPLMQDLGKYELAGEASTAGLGGAVVEIAETAMRAEMLKVLAPSFRARGFREEVLARAAARELPITPQAPMPTRHGGRRSVTVRIESRQPVWVQAVSGKNSAIDGFDKAQAVFSSAHVERDSLVAVLADQVKLESWQWETLREAGRPLMAADFDKFLAELTPA